MQGPQPAPRPQRPGTSRPTPDRRAAAEARAAEAAKGTRSTSIRIGDLPKRGKMGGAAEAAIYAAGDAAINWYGNALRSAVQRERSQRAAESGQRGRYVPGNQQVKFEKPAPPKKSPENKPAKADRSAPNSSAPSRYIPSRTAPSSSPAPSKPAAPAQSKNMEENFAAWTKANKGLAEKVKPNQAGYAAIKKTLDGLKIKDKGKK